MFLKAILGLWLMVMAPVAVLADATEEAKKPVDRLNETLIQIMKDAKPLGYQGRYKKLEPVVKDVFEFEAVARLAIGNTQWKNLDKPQKIALMEKLADLSVATYAAQFNDYGGEAFKFDTLQESKGSWIILRYDYGAPKDKPIKFDYYVSEANGRWRIINIIVDGISDLALKKAQYTSVIDREGFDSLLNKLSQKIADYAKNNSMAGKPGSPTAP